MGARAEIRPLPDWLKFKNPACEAVRREAEEDWGQESRAHDAQRASDAQG